MSNIREVIDIIKHHLWDVVLELHIWANKSEELRNYKPSEGEWSINEIIEHIALTNHYLLILIDKAGNKALKKVLKSEEQELIENYRLENDKLLEIGIHNAFKWVRPEHMLPTGIVDILQNQIVIIEQRNRCFRWLEQLADGKGCLVKTTMTVNNLGKLDVYQYIYFLSLHIERHLTQMTVNEHKYSQN